MNEHMEDNNQEITLQSMDEIANLNLADLDVQELEKRLELALAAPDALKSPEADCMVHGGTCGINY